MISIRYRLCPDGYEAAGYKVPVRHSSQPNKEAVVATSSALADTGCTTMVAGMTFVQNLGLKASDLLPVRTEIKAANKTEIKIIGAIIVDIRVNGGDNNKVAKQVVYITSSVDKVFLNLESLIQLGLIQDSFPKTVCNLEEPEECTCPIRTKPPPLPESLPFPEDQPEKLREWLLQRYASSTFNTCTHQPLPLMSGEPLRIYVDPNVKPLACAF